MSLRKKTLIHLVGALTLQMLVLGILAAVIQGFAFSDLENDYLAEAADRLHGALESELDRLDRNTRDYLQWDETWDYMHEPSLEFADENFSADSIYNVQIAMWVMVDTQRQVRLERAVDPAGENLIDLPPSFRRKVLSMMEAQLSSAEPDRCSKGAIRLPEGVVLYALRPVLHNDGTGPSAGLGLAARWLDETLVEYCEHFSGLTVTIGEGDAFSGGELLGQVESALPAQVRMRNLSDEVAEVEVAIAGVDGLVACTLNGRVERRITVHGSLSIRILLGCMALLSVLWGAATLFLLNRRVLAPITGISSQLRALTQEDRLGTRILCDRKDELGTLADDMNALLANLEETHQKLHDSIESERAANRAKDRFLANMSHEIRTPLNGIMGMAEVLLNSQTSPDQAEAIEMINSSSSVLLTVINDILDYSKIVAGKLELRPQPVLLRKLVHEVTSLMRLAAEKRGLALNLDWDPAVPEMVRCDPDRLKQVLLNLLANAVKFTNEGSVTLSGKAIGGTGGEPLLHMEVRDTGVGIRAEALATIFDPFVQVDSSFTRRSGGTGLGLSICKQLVSQMGGELRVQSTVGVGSTFWLEIPLATPTEDTGKTSCRKLGTGFARAHPLRILLAEDNPVNSAVAISILKRMGYSPVLAANGAEALSMALGGDFDLVLMDIQMPEMDGLEATRQILAHMGPSSCPSVVALTAHALEGDARGCFEAGMVAHLTKPLQVERLCEVLAAVHQQRHAETVTGQALA